MTVGGSHLLFLHTHTLPPKRRSWKYWEYWECRTTKGILGCSICESHLPVQVMQCLFILFSGEWGRSGKREAILWVSLKKLQVVANSAYSLLSKITMRNAEFESRWLTGQNWLGNKKIEILFDLCQIFLLMSVFTLAAVLLPVLQWVVIEELCDITLHQYTVFLVHLDIVHFFSYASKI